jgi:hypothetical protein
MVGWLPVACPDSSGRWCEGHGSCAMPLGCQQYYQLERYWDLHLVPGSPPQGCVAAETGQAGP